MPIIYGWSAARSGTSITITHSTGKLANVVSIAPNGIGQLIALTAGGTRYELSNHAHSLA